ncbi:hypothetical protein SAMN05444141_1262, partial [Pseudovibrio denitrificans]
MENRETVVFLERLAALPITAFPAFDRVSTPKGIVKMTKFARMIMSKQILQKVLGLVLGLTVGAAAHASTED